MDTYSQNIRAKESDKLENVFTFGKFSMGFGNFSMGQLAVKYNLT